jgi:photosystem II stability/assembly factor-like uncharacterized protein
MTLIMKKQIFLLSFIMIACVKVNGQIGVDLNDVIHYRNFAPYHIGSWIAPISVPDTEDPKYKNTYYAAGRTGGVWKTINNGTTFFPVFDEVEMNSIGDIGISSSSPEELWVGTGEPFCTRGSYAGNGVYYSPNGGESWQFKGLKNTQHISRVIVHPTNPEVVYVAAMGNLFTPNPERGVFKTTNRGKTWEKVLFVDDNTGVIDLLINPSNPDILYASTYEKYRFPWHFEAGGEQSAIYQSKDGGDTWNKLAGGLPTGKLGRIGLGLCYHQPEIVYAVIENLNPKPGVTINENVEMNHQRDPYFDQMIGGEVYRSDNNGANWEKRNNSDCNVSEKAAYSFNKILVSPTDPERIIVSSVALLNSFDGGRTWLDCSLEDRKLFLNMFGDIRSLWVNPNDEDHMMIGSDGGLYVTYDGGKTVDHKHQIPLGEFYTVETDNEDPYHMYFGIQDHEAWKAPVNGWSGRIRAGDWDATGMWDGMYNKVNQKDSRWAYISTQFGSHQRVDQVLGARTPIQPIRPKGEKPYRYCWTAPIEISSHNPDIIYVGAEVLLRSFDKGDNWHEISPDLTTNNEEKIAGKGHIMYCTITSISESKITPGIIWVGTDDGKVHVTRDHGKTWSEVTQAIADQGGRSNLWVNKVQSSQHDEGTAYVCKSGFKFDDYTPLVFKTTDFGKTWKKITNKLPNLCVNTVIEDPKNPDLLYIGNDKGIYASFNQGESWDALRANMPYVPVKDIKVHERENDLIAATYGRGAFVTDVSFLQQLNEKVLKEDVHLFAIEPKPVRNYSEQAYWGNIQQFGDNHLFTPNEYNEITIYYNINKKIKADSWIEILNSDGTVIERMDAETNKGLHSEKWNIAKEAPGIYKIKLHIGEVELEQEAILKTAPVWPTGNKYL